MTNAQSEAHMRLLQSLPVRTHNREEPPEVNKYTGKPLPSECQQRALAKRVFPSRVNTWVGRKDAA